MGAPLSLVENVKMRGFQIPMNQERMVLRSRNLSLPTSQGSEKNAGCRTECLASAGTCGFSESVPGA